MRLHYRYVSYGVGRQTVDQMTNLYQLMNQMMTRTPAGTTGAWQPPTDVYETAEAVVIQVELAGVREEDIDITLYADHLGISGSRANRIPTTGAAYHLAGILYGDFRVTVPVMTNVDRENVEATFDNGLLTVTLPKAVKQIEPITIQPTTAQS